MTRLLTVILLILSFTTFAAGLPSFMSSKCPPGNPYCKKTTGDGPPPVKLDDAAPKACAPDDQECIKNYSKQQTDNYQSGVKDPNFVNPVHGGGGCILSDQSKCKTSDDSWNTNTVKPVTTREVPYVTGARPEFDQKQQCKSVYSPFSRTTVQNCQ